ncbi:hypothetical protein M115_3071 [Bacteroides fragilis str. 3719 T6]|nr:hypothetical protein M085_4729 [Bacteroides fragilis str. 3986 N(B)19]EYA23500.1 hypothetical protein M103_3546 [Bacteroides fragilis str. 1007-1-F \
MKNRTFGGDSSELPLFFIHSKIMNKLFVSIHIITIFA